MVSIEWECVVFSFVFVSVVRGESVAVGVVAASVVWFLSVL